MPPKNTVKQPVDGGKADGGHGSAARDGASAGAEPMDVTGDVATTTSGASMTTQQVRQIAEQLQAACGKFAEGLADSAEQRLRDHGVTDVILKDVKSFLSRSKGTHEIGQLMEDLKKAVPLEMPSASGTEIHPGIKQLNFHNFIENTRSDVNDSLAELVQWVAKQLNLNEQEMHVLDGKKDSFLARNDAVLASLEQDLKEKLAKEASRISFDFGRGSMAWESEELSTVEEEWVQEIAALQKEIVRLKTEIGMANVHAAEMMERLSRLPALDSANRLLRCDDLELDGRIAQLLRQELEGRSQIRVLQTNAEELEARLAETNAASFQDAERKIAELEQQLLEADDKLHKMKKSKDDLEKLLEAQMKKHDGETTGRRQSLEERLQALGLVGGQQGQLQRAEQPVLDKGFNVSTPYVGNNGFV